MFLVFRFKESLNFFVILIKTNLGVCEILVPGNPLLKSERCLKTVQLSFTSSELCSSASKRLQR